MKKQIFGGIAIVAIAIVVALNVNITNKKSDKTSLLALANVEALADGENNGASGYTCISGATYGGLGIARLCSSCVWQFGLSGYTSIGTCL